MLGNPDRQPREITPDLIDSGVLTAGPRKPTAVQMIRRYWLPSIAFVAFLVVVFLFAALGLVGN